MPIGQSKTVWCNLVAKFATSASVATWWPILEPMQMAPLSSITNWATRWRYLQFWPLIGAKWKLGHQVTPLVFVQNLVIRWCHLHWFQSWPSGGTTCRCYNFSHQVASHCLGMPYWQYQLVLSWYPHQPESHQLSLNKVLDSVSEWVSEWQVTS